MPDQRAGQPVLRLLRDRLGEKAVTLSEMADRASALGERSRLRGKAEGVDLALSFIDEAIKDQERHPSPDECIHLLWTAMPNGTTWCRACGVETTEMEAMGG